MPFLRQSDIPPTWPDTGRPNPWADLSGTDAGRYYGWPVVHRSAAGDVWQTRPDAFVVLDGSCQVELSTLADAVAWLG